MVPDTVVPPTNPRAITTAMSLLLVFTALSQEVASSDTWPWLRPTWILPPMMATVAGVAPACLMVSSTCIAISMLVGKGIPWVMMVDSRLTTGPPLLRASLTSGLSTRHEAEVRGRELGRARDRVRDSRPRSGAMATGRGTLQRPRDNAAPTAEHQHHQHTAQHQLRTPSLK